MTTGWRVLKIAASPPRTFRPRAPNSGTAMIDRRQADGPQDAIGHRARTGNLQEVTTAGVKIELQHRGSCFAG